MLDLTNGKPTIKRSHRGRPKNEKGEVDRREYHLNWIKNNPDKVQRYRIKSMIKNREKAIEKMSLELGSYKDILEKMTSDNTNAVEEVQS